MLPAGVRPVKNSKGYLRNFADHKQGAKQSKESHIPAACSELTPSKHFPKHSLGCGSHEKRSIIVVSKAQNLSLAEILENKTTYLDS